MAVGKKPAEVVGKIIPNTGNRLSDPREFGKFLQSDLIKRVETNPTEVVGKFIANTKDPRVYDLRELGKVVQSDLIDHLAKIWRLDGLYMLQEDENKDEVNRHDNYNSEELDGLNIPGDACKLTTHTGEDKENDSSDKYEVVYVKDEETGVEHIAIELIVVKLHDILRNDKIVEVAKLIDRLTTTNECTVREVGDLIEKYKIRAPVTNNILSPTYRRNPLYKASKDPIKTIGDMHRDIRKNLFDHCHSELNSGRAKFPYGVFQLYTDTRPETAPGQCLFKFKDPKVLQLVYYVNHSDKSHLGDLKVQNLTILMFTMDMQNSEDSLKLISFQDAVSQGIVSNQVVAYFIGKIYKFYNCIGMSDKLRFKQQCDAECWVAEIECSGGWIECTRIYVKNDAALEAKPDPIEVEGKNDAALEAKPDPIEAEGTSIRPDLSQLKSAFKNNYKKVAEALEAMGEEEKEAMMADVNSKGEYKLFVGTLSKMVTIKRTMLQVTKEKKIVHKSVSNVYVAAVSFRIGRIVCCLYEHAYNTKPGKDETLNVFSFPPFVAPYKCFVIENKKYKTATELTKESLDKAHIRYMTVPQGKHGWKKLIISDECGCPFAVRVNSEESVTIHERDSNLKINVKVDDVGQLIHNLLIRVCTWKDACKKYPRGT